MKPLIEYLVQALVDTPEQVRVEEFVGASGTTYAVTVAPEDQGQVIGKQGHIANALRTLAKCVAMKHKQRVYIQIVGSPSRPAVEGRLSGSTRSREHRTRPDQP